MQTGRNLVGIAVEFSTRVQFRHDDLNRSHMLLGVDVRRNAAPVIDDANAVSRQNGDFDMGAKTGQRFIDRVIYNFPNKMVKAHGIG